ncbi:hypothetical protein vBSenM1_08 [Salmonella phage vB_SenM-1]|uniref:Uncharacterized protein n=1 Tax=Salmonella phage vB_SenM-1 TaxID=2732255 RepID=A0A6M4BH89_9CAUD|nr:hypothetical protein vBSenM1_08 [Salmonella phage vB_SenM-1]
MNAPLRRCIQWTSLHLSPYQQSIKPGVLKQ